MNKPKVFPLGLGFVFSLMQTQAQGAKDHLNEPDYNKPQLFADLPLRMNLQLSGISRFLSAETGSEVSIQLSEGFSFEGTIVSKSDAKDPSVESIVVRSSNRPGAILTFSKINTGKDVIYRGRILSRNNSDAFDIKEENGVYSLVKRSLYDSLNE